jgi:hypothetical protein
MDALSASMFVDRDISSITPVFDAISFIASTVRRTDLPPSSELCADCYAMFSVICAFSVFCLMFDVIC